jgi:ribosomal protein S18 acetylase RimI-like enzyme
MEIAIRQMREADLDVVSDLVMLANPHVVKEKYRKLILDVFKANPDLFFVAVVGGTVVGYAQAEVRGDRADLNDIAVAEDNQRRGIGRQLLLTVLDAVKAKGAKILLAEVHHKCASAIPFYYAHGFRISGSVQDYFGAGHDAVIVKLVFQ